MANVIDMLTKIESITSNYPNIDSKHRIENIINRMEEEVFKNLHQSYAKLQTHYNTKGCYRDQASDIQ